MDSLELAGVWTGLAISLLVLSMALGDHWLARLGQHLLVGAVMGYAALMAWQLVLLPGLILPLFANPTGDPLLWATAALALLLLAAALERLFAMGAPGPLPGGLRLVLRRLGQLPVALMLGVGLAVLLVGALQGTLFPQLIYTIRYGVEWQLPLANLIAGMALLLITTGALVAFTVQPHHLAGQPRLLQRLINGWIWIGRRAIWLAMGVLFARLAASRISLLAAEFVYLRQVLEQTGLWSFFESFGRGGGGG
jgi:hypothetical protein